MANAGYSSDHVLCHAVTTGIWNRKYGNQAKYEVISLPLHKNEDDRHQTVLKNYLYDYYNAYHNPDKRPWYIVEDSKRGRNLIKIIYQMNQYRQKHWYWKAIN